MPTGVWACTLDVGSSGATQHGAASPVVLPSVAVDSPLEVSPVVEVAGVGSVVDDAALVPSVVVAPSVAGAPVVGTSVVAAVLVDGIGVSVDEGVVLDGSGSIAVEPPSGASGPHAAIINQQIASRCIRCNIAFEPAGLMGSRAALGAGLVPCFTRKARETRPRSTDSCRPGHACELPPLVRGASMTGASGRDGATNGARRRCMPRVPAS
ncbi:hypothetical protein [Nannocystis exedens]|uniref:hypothetical protein n=1 Tax=Nannocystis exedens TaxID=54 RepID=UPI0011607C5B|nr:hypothetical protein [Nannocystis exedens]